MSNSNENKQASKDWIGDKHSVLGCLGARNEVL
jgi:hypothetical protein